MAILWIYKETNGFRGRYIRFAVSAGAGEQLLKRASFSPGSCYYNIIVSIAWPGTGLRDRDPLDTSVFDTIIIINRRRCVGRSAMDAAATVHYSGRRTPHRRRFDTGDRTQK